MVEGLWTEERFSFEGQFYRTEEAICAPKPAKPPRDPRIELLPGTLRPMAERVGVEPVEKLLVRYGGQRIYIPLGAQRSEIAELCGERLAEALATAYGGRMFKVPVGEHLTTQRKHQMIRDDPRPANQVAAAFGMHVDSIHRIRGRAPDDRQLDLEAWLKESASKVA